MTQYTLWILCSANDLIGTLICPSQTVIWTVIAHLSDAGEGGGPLLKQFIALLSNKRKA